MALAWARDCVTDFDVTAQRLWDQVQAWQDGQYVYLRVYGPPTPIQLGDTVLKMTPRQARQLGKQLLSGNDGSPKDQQDPGPGGQGGGQALSAEAPASEDPPIV